MKRNLFDVDKLREIRERLPFKSNKEICRRLGRSATTVSNTLNGRMNTPGVIEEAIKIIAGENAKRKELELLHKQTIK